MTKAEQRKQIQAQRAALSPADWAQKSDSIRQHLLQSELYRTAPVIFTYINIHNEVDTRTLLRTAWADGKQVAVPVCSTGGQMAFYAITADTPLQQTKQGTLEPTPTAQLPLHPTASDLFLVPGLVFDAHGNRYGYGGGFYDRYLARYSDTVPTALCFALQISAQTLTAQPHDIPMAQLLSENGWHICSK